MYKYISYCVGTVYYLCPFVEDSKTTKVSQVLSWEQPELTHTADRNQISTLCLYRKRHLDTFCSPEKVFHLVKLTKTRTTMAQAVLYCFNNITLTDWSTHVYKPQPKPTFNRTLTGNFPMEVCCSLHQKSDSIKGAARLTGAIQSNLS